MTGPIDIVAPSVALFVLFFLLGIICWIFSVSFAEKVLPAPDPEAKVTSLSARDLERVLFRTLGVFLAVTAASGLAFSTLLAAQAGKKLEAPEMVRAAVQFVGGALLFMGKSGMSRAFEAVRSGGDYVEETETGEDAEAEKEHPGGGGA